MSSDDEDNEENEKLRLNYLNENINKIYLEFYFNCKLVQAGVRPGYLSDIHPWTEQYQIFFISNLSLLFPELIMFKICFNFLIILESNLSTIREEYKNINDFAYPYHDWLSKKLGYFSYLPRHNHNQSKNVIFSVDYHTFNRSGKDFEFVIDLYNYVTQDFIDIKMLEDQVQKISEILKPYHVYYTIES